MNKLRSTDQLIDEKLREELLDAIHSAKKKKVSLNKKAISRLITKLTKQYETQ